MPANWRKRIWKPALEAARLQRDGEIWMLDAGIEVFEFARLMGTSVAMLTRPMGTWRRGTSTACVSA